MISKLGIRPQRDRNFFLKLISKATTHSQFQQTHAQIIQNSLQSDLATVTKLVQKLSDFGFISYSSQICSTFRNPYLFLYNVIIRSYSINNQHFNSLSVYRKLRENLKNLGLMLHGQAIVSGVGLELFVGSSIVDMYLNFGDLGYAYKVFDKMFQRDTVLCNTLISGCVKNGCFDEAVLVFNDMVLNGVRFDSTSFAVVITAAVDLNVLKLGMAIQGLSVKFGFHSDVHVVTGFISLYAKCGDMLTARWLFHQIQKPDVIAYNAMISGFSCNGEMENVVGLFTEMLVLQEKFSSSTIVGLIHVLYPFDHLSLISTIHSFCVKSNLVYKTPVATALITVYGT